MSIESGGGMVLEASYGVFVFLKAVLRGWESGPVSPLRVVQLELAARGPGPGRLLRLVTSVLAVL